MSKQIHYQVQYVAKDQYDAKKDDKPYKKYYNNNHDYGYKNNKKSNRNNYQNPKVEYEQKQQINQPSNNVYDAKSLISAFRERLEPPQEISALIQKIPQLFATKPSKPFPASTQQNLSDEEEPEWMQSTEFNGNFSIKDIEAEMQTKREQYQKNHGTFEKKQEERTKKQSDESQSQLEFNEIEMEKQKYRDKIEQEQKQNQAADETKAKLFQLFTISQQIAQPIEPPAKVLTVEQIEQEALKNKKDDESFDDELDRLLGIKLNGQIISEQSVAPKKIFDNQLIKTKPFQIQTDLHQKSLTEPLWFYIDKHNKIQGPFPTKNMDVWYSQNYLKSNLMISWLAAGKWIYLEQFQQNLELIYSGQLDKLKAMDPTTIDPLKQCKQITQQQPTYNNSQNYNQNTNHNNNKFHQNYNYQYNQQYTQNYQYNQQSRNRNNNNQGKAIFQIGLKEHSQYNYNYNQSSYQEASDEGLVLDPRNFPTLDEK